MISISTTLLALMFSSLIPTIFSQSTYTPFPNKTEIGRIFNLLATGNDTGFFTNVDVNVNWTVMGTHPLAGQYHNRSTFAIDTLERLAAIEDPSHPFELSVVNIIGGATEEWSVQELMALGICKNGLVFNNRYSWATRWNTRGVIVEVRAYLDSALIAKAITENESKEYNYIDQRISVMPGPVGAGCSTQG